MRGLGGAGFLSAANGAKSPLWEGWFVANREGWEGFLSSPLWGQVSYPRRIGNLAPPSPHEGDFALFAGDPGPSPLKAILPYPRRIGNLAPNPPSPAIKAILPYSRHEYGKIDFMGAGRGGYGGWEGPGFLSAADRAKSPLWEGWGQVSYPTRIGQNDPEHYLWRPFRPTLHKEFFQSENITGCGVQAQQIAR